MPNFRSYFDHFYVSQFFRQHPKLLKGSITIGVPFYALHLYTSLRCLLLRLTQKSKPTNSILKKELSVIIKKYFRANCLSVAKKGEDRFWPCCRFILQRMFSICCFLTVPKIDARSIIIEFESMKTHSVVKTWNCRENKKDRDLTCSYIFYAQNSTIDF